MANTEDMDRYSGKYNCIPDEFDSGGITDKEELIFGLGQLVNSAMENPQTHYVANSMSSITREWMQEMLLGMCRGRWQMVMPVGIEEYWIIVLDNGSVIQIRDKPVEIHNG